MPKVISSHLFVFEVVFLSSFSKKFLKIKKLRPFFQSAHQANFKNAKKFEKFSFFKEI